MLHSDNKQYRAAGRNDVIATALQPHQHPASPTGIDMNVDDDEVIFLTEGRNVLTTVTTNFILLSL